MSGLKNIISGHINELFKTNQSISQTRLKICAKCPLKKKDYMGYVCDSKGWINPETDEYSSIKKDGYVHGCGCRLFAKTTVASEKCPAGKW